MIPAMNSPKTSQVLDWRLSDTWVGDFTIIEIKAIDIKAVSVGNGTGGTAKVQSRIFWRLDNDFRPFVSYTRSLVRGVNLDKLSTPK